MENTNLSPQVTCPSLDSSDSQSEYIPSPAGSQTRRKKKVSYHLPKKETMQHREMFAYYWRLGKDRSLRKVAREFGVSLPTVLAVSRAFGWQERIKTYERELKDPVLVDIKLDVDDSRRKLVYVVHELVGILEELVKIAQEIKAGNDGSEETSKRVEELHDALKVFGLQLKTPKDLRDLVMTLKEVEDFRQEQLALMQSGDKYYQQFNIQEAKLIIKED